MGKREEIETTEDLVKRILEKSKKARNSDEYLYVRVIKELYPDALNYPFEWVMLNVRKCGLPCYETVSRERRKIQAEHPELWSNETVRRYRREAEEVFKEYARR